MQTAGREKIFMGHKIQKNLFDNKKKSFLFHKYQVPMILIVYCLYQGVATIVYTKYRVRNENSLHTAGLEEKSPSPLPPELHNVPLFFAEIFPGEKWLNLTLT